MLCTEFCLRIHILCTAAVLQPGGVAGWAVPRLGLRFDCLTLLSGGSAVLWGLTAPRVRLFVCAGGS